MNKIGIAVIGCGYFGPSLVKHFYENPTSDVVFCCDLDPDRLALMKLRHPDVTL